MDVSVCIVNWNTRELLARCLQSIRQHTDGVAVEVIVVDNGSSDGSAAMIALGFPEVRLIEPDENLGFARGCNLAAASASGQCVLYLNPDTELATNAIHGMWQFLMNSPAYGAVGCRLLNTDGSIQPTCAAALPTPRNELSALLFLDRLFPRSRAFRPRELADGGHDDSRDAECLSGACMMLPRALALRLGGFDEHLFMYGEDLDLCCRIRREGLRLRYLASETIYHHEGSASRKRGRSFAPTRQRAANHYVLRKHFGRASALGYRAAVLVGSCVRLLGAIALSPLWALGRDTGRPALGAFIGRHADLFMWSIGVKGRLPR